MFGFDHLISQTRTIGNKYLKFLFFLFYILIQQLIIRIQTSFTFSLTGFRSHTYPIQLTLKCFTTFACSLLFHLHTFGLLFKPARVVTFPRNTFTTVQFKNPSGYMIKEVTVMRYGNYRTLILLQVLFKPIDRLSIKVVGRLIKEKDIWLL